MFKRERAEQNIKIISIPIEDIPVYKSSIPLRPYQKRGSYLLTENEGYLLNHGMGAGKTIQAITAACELFRRGEILKVMIICPLSAISVWEKQIQEHGTEAELEWAVTNYESIRCENKISTSKNFNDAISYAFKSEGKTILILDEAHRLRDAESQQSQGCRAIAGLCSRRWMLSGTVTENKLKAVYGMGKIIAPDFFPIGSQTAFEAFCETAKNRKLVMERLKGFCYSVTKEEALPYLPAVQYEEIKLELSEEQDEIYSDLEELAITEIQMEAEEKGTVTITTIMTQMMRLAQCVSGFIGTDSRENVGIPTNRYEEILDFVQGNDVKTIIFSPKRYEQQKLEEGLIKREMTYVTFLASDNKEQRERAVKSFQEIAEIKVILLSSKAGSESIDLSAAESIIFASNDYSRIVREQCVSRAHRHGLKSSVTITDFPGVRRSGKETISRYIMKMLGQKERNVSDLITFLKGEK